MHDCNRKPGERLEGQCSNRKSTPAAQFRRGGRWKGIKLGMPTSWTRSADNNDGADSTAGKVETASEENPMVTLDCEITFDPPAVHEPVAPPLAPQVALGALGLAAQLAHDHSLPFDRVRTKSILRERLASFQGTAEARTLCLADALLAFGLIGRVRFLSIAEAIQAGREGLRLVAAVEGDAANSRWVYLRAAGPKKALLAAAEGADVAVSEAQMIGLLGTETAEAVVPWLLVEPALPCAAEEQFDGMPVDGHGPPTHEESSFSPLRRLLAILRPEAKDIWVVGVFSGVVSLLALATPVTVEALVNTVAFGRLMQPVVVLSLILLGFLGFAAAMRLLQAYVAELIQRRLFVRVVADLSQRLPRARQEAYDGVHGPELLNRFFDVMTVQKSAALLVLDGIAIVLQAVVGMAVLALYHPLLLGFDLALLASLSLVVFVLGRGGVATSIEESKAKYAVAAWLEQLALCPLAFKNAGGPERALEHADQLAMEYLRARESHFRVLIRQVGFTLVLQALAGSVLLGIGGWLVIQGQLTLGQLVAAELIVAVLVGSFAKLGKHMEAYYDLLAAVDKLGHLFDLPVEPRGGDLLTDSSQGLSVRLASQEIKSGEMVAIVGPPGSGKSRLLASIFGIVDGVGYGPQIAGHDVATLDRTALRQRVALVRNSEVFAGTIEDNVLLHHADGTRAAARACLEELGLRNCLRSLPEGLNTVLQPGGIPLADSEARCLVLARALLGQPSVLLIDGLLDGVADEMLPAVAAALSRRAGQTTILIATGRQEIARLCQRVLPIEAVREGAVKTPSADNEARY
jgi:ABC-type bacteriocin/lantibiotic exporter with double-glycine peptidase domain